jgi:outer membrane lipoprotein carrier protein
VKQPPVCAAPVLLCLLFAISSSVPPATGQTAQEPSCERILSKVSALLRHTQFLRARFRHALHSKALNQNEVEEGVLTLARGGRMRWEYSSPEGKLAVSDGRTSYLYLPDQKIVYVQPLPQGKEAPLPLRLLMGEVQLDEEFFCQGAIPRGGLVELLLVPRQPVEGVQKIRVTVGEASGDVREVRYEDALGNEVSLSLQDVEHPAELPASLFRFVAPEGCRVVQGG